jgi:hypothetical protein
MENSQAQSPSEQWGHGIDTATATGAEMTSFIQWRIDVYRQKGWTNSDLSEYYAADFHNFTREHFESCSSDTVRDLRDHLRHYGVYVRKGRGFPIARELHTAIETELDWPDDDNSNGSPHSGDTKTTRNQPDPTSTRYTPTSPPGTSAPPRDTPAPSRDTPAPPQDTSATIPIPQDRAVANSGHGEQPVGKPRHEGHGYGRELANLAKMYPSEDEKYSGNPTDSFNYKRSIFLDYCEQVDIPPEVLHKAFPTMLCGLAKDFYFKSCRGKNLPFDALCNSIRRRFETDEHGRLTLLEWNTTTLQSIIDKNPDKTTAECLDLLIKKFTTLQRSLPDEYHQDKILHDKIVVACRSSPTCHYACYKPADTIAGLIGDLQSSIATHQEATKSTSNNFVIDNDNGDDPEAFLTDRRYHERRSTPNRHRSTWKRGRCFVCGRPGCWSTKHTPAERQKSTSRLKQRIDQYIADYEERPESNDSPPQPEDEELPGIEALVLDTEPDPIDTSSFVTACSTLEPAEANAMITQLADRSTAHALIHQVNDDIINPDFEPDFDPDSSKGRYTSKKFYGILLDSGASARSTAGYGQYLAYVKTFGEKHLDTSTAGSVHAQFGIGSTSSIGSVDIDTPIGKATFHVVKADTPFLLCLQDMDAMGVYFNNVRNVIICANGRTQPVIRAFGHPFLIWGPTVANFLTEIELRQLHRRFGHPAANRLARLLERAGHDSNRVILERINKLCTFCQRHGRSPGRFKFTLHDDVSFNHTIIVDVMYIDGSPILHVADEATRFQAARWLNNMTAQTTWDTLRLCWIDVYVGPPDIIIHDAGTNFTATEFQQNATAMAIKTKCAPVEAAQTIGSVERYHAPLRRAFSVISEELKGTGANKTLILQMAVKSVNDTAGPDGLVPTLLVFGAYPRMTPLDPPAPTITQRAMAIRKAMTEVSKLLAARQVNDALRERNGPRTGAVHSLAIGSNVLVWRMHEKKWTGPFKLIATEGETCTVALPSGPTQFRSTVVKPFSDDQDDQPKESHSQSGQETDADDPPQKSADGEQVPRRNPTRPRRLPNRYASADVAVYISNVYKSFTESRRQELNGLLERGVFEIVDEKTLPEESRVFRSRFVDTVKNEGTAKAYEKSRLVVQAYDDADKQEVLTQAPTIQRASQRLLLALVPSLPDVKIHLRDISQAYTQSATTMMRNIFVKPPAEMALPPGKLLYIIRPLYGIPEAGTHWFRTYHDHHTEKLRMTQSTYDPCLLFTRERPGFGIVGLQTDDTLFAADATFAAREDSELKKANFEAKPCETLTPTHPLKFNGAIIETRDSKICISQPEQIKRIQPVSTDSTLKAQYIAQRARGAYIASVCQPQMTFGLSFAAQTTSPAEDDAKFLNRCLSWQIRNATRGLTFVPLDIQTMEVVVFTDSSFANNRDLSSQIGFVVALADANGDSNIIHWASVKSRRVTRSVLASELYAMSLGFDAAAAIKSTLDQILQPWRQEPVPLTVFTDSKSLYDCLVKIGMTREKRLMIDIMCLRQAYERREIAEVVWIKGEENVADAMTKEKCSNALRDMVDTNKLMITADGWVERET